MTSVSGIIGIVVGVVVLLAVFSGLYSTYTTSVDDANDTIAASGGASASVARTILNMTKWLFPLGIGIGILYLILRKTGVMGGGGWG